MHGLIVELARYERAEHEVALTVDSLQLDMAEGRFSVSWPRRQAKWAWPSTTLATARGRA